VPSVVSKINMPVSVCSGGGVNSGSVPAGINAAAAGGAGLMMLNGAAATAMNPAASGLLMPGGAAAGGTGLVMQQRPVMLPSAGSPAAGYLLAGGAGITAPTMMQQYVVGYPQTGVSPELAAASPYGVSVPSAAYYR